MMKISILFLATLLLAGCGGHDTASITLKNNSTYDTTISLRGMDVENVIILPGETKSYFREIHRPLVFSYTNTIRSETYSWFGPVDAWFAMDFAMTITFSNTGVDFGDSTSEWTKFP
jgi:hypothetical protein